MSIDRATSESWSDAPYVCVVAPTCPQCGCAKYDRIHRSRRRWHDHEESHLPRVLKEISHRHRNSARIEQQRIGHRIEFKRGGNMVQIAAEKDFMTSAHWPPSFSALFAQSKAPQSI
jgi:hypothetical protein